MTFAQPSRNGMIGDAVRIADELTTRIRDAEANRPRSLQRRIGPSGVGEPCDLKLAYMVGQWPAVNDNNDPLPVVIGGAVHEKLAAWFSALNDTERLADGSPRWLVEHGVEVRTGLTGSVDLFDRATGTVLDWKVLGDTGHKKVKSEGPGPTYRVQLQLYGKGMLNAGETVNRVGLVAIPKAGLLSNLHVWTADYDERVVEEALERMDNITIATVGLDVFEHPERLAYIQRSPSRLCAWCSYYLPGSTDFGKGCRGNT